MDTYSTAVLMGVIAQITQFDQFLLNLFFRNKVEFNTAEIAIDKVAKNLKMAPFVSPLVSGKARQDLGYSTRSFAPAYLKPKGIVDINRLIKRVAGEGFSGELDPARRRDLVIADILMENDEQINRRLEWMAAQALLTGKVVVSGDDYGSVEVDFGRTGTLTKTLLTTARWGETGVVPIDDIESWCDEAEAPVTDIVMDGEAWKLFRTDTDTRNLLDTRRGSRSQLEIGPSNGRNFSYKGTLGADLDVWVYNGTYVDDAGATQKFLPDYTVLLGSQAIEGTQAFGGIMSPGAGYRAMERYPRHFIKQDPEVEVVETQSAPLVIPGRPDASVAITVR